MEKEKKILRSEKEARHRNGRSEIARGPDADVQGHLHADIKTPDLRRRRGDLTALGDPRRSSHPVVWIGD